MFFQNAGGMGTRIGKADRVREEACGTNCKFGFLLGLREVRFDGRLIASMKGSNRFWIGLLCLFEEID